MQKEEAEGEREGGREGGTYREVLPSVGKVDVLLVQGQDLVVGNGAGVGEIVNA